MPASFRRHDSTAKHLALQDRAAYDRLKAELTAGRIDQEEVDARLNAFFWQCFETDAEDEPDED